MASRRATPTSNCTVRMAMPGRDIEYTSSTPASSLITCSAGVATRLSTSATLAPGKGTNTLAKVTSICGSSSLGVISTANRPSSKPVSAISGVSSEAWNCAAMRPAIPKRLLSIGLLPGGQLLQYDAGIAGDDLAGDEAGQYLDLVAEDASGAHLGQARRVAVEAVYGGQFLALQHGAGRHGEHLAAAGDQLDARKHARVDAVDAGIQFGADTEAVAAGFGVGKHGDVIAGQARAVIQYHGQAALAAYGVNIALRYGGGDPNAIHRQAGDQRLARCGQLADFNVTIGKNARVRSNQLRIGQLLARLVERCLGLLLSCPGGIQCGTGAIEVGL